MLFSFFEYLKSTPNILRCLTKASTAEEIQHSQFNCIQNLFCLISEDHEIQQIKFFNQRNHVFTLNPDNSSLSLQNLLYCNTKNQQETFLDIFHQFEANKKSSTFIFRLPNLSNTQLLLNQFIWKEDLSVISPQFKIAFNEYYLFIFFYAKQCLFMFQILNNHIYGKPRIGFLQVPNAPFEYLSMFASSQKLYFFISKSSTPLYSYSISKLTKSLKSIRPSQSSQSVKAIKPPKQVRLNLTKSSLIFSQKNLEKQIIHIFSDGISTNAIYLSKQTHKINSLCVLLSAFLFFIMDS